MLILCTYSLLDVVSLNESCSRRIEQLSDDPIPEIKLPESYFPIRIITPPNGSAFNSLVFDFPPYRQ